MKHLFVNDENDYIAADTAEQARDCHVEMVGWTDNLPGARAEDWSLVDDDESITILMDPPDNPVTKTAAAWAARQPVPILVSSEDW